jgi:hypothetical protein
VIQRLTQTLLFLAAVQLLGGHWLALQSVAWVGMMVSYSRGESMGRALIKTFDGTHPCSLCEVVKKGHGDERKRDLPAFSAKIEAVVAAKPQLPEPAVRSMAFTLQNEEFAALAHAPPTPPPLAA